MNPDSDFCHIFNFLISHNLMFIFISRYVSPLCWRMFLKHRNLMIVCCPHLTPAVALSRHGWWNWNFLFTWFELSLLIFPMLLLDRLLWLTQISFLSSPASQASSPPSQPELPPRSQRRSRSVFSGIFQQSRVSFSLRAPDLLTALRKLTLSLPSPVKLGLEFQSFAGGPGHRDP